MKNAQCQRKKRKLQESEQTYCSLFSEIMTSYGVHQFCKTMGIYAHVFSAGSQKTATDVERAVTDYLQRYERLATIAEMIKIRQKHPYKDAQEPSWRYEQRQQRLQEVEVAIKPELESMRKGLEQVLQEEVLKVMEKDKNE